MGSKLKKDLDLELGKKKKERSACMHVCIHVYIYDPVKTKPKNCELSLQCLTEERDVASFSPRLCEGSVQAQHLSVTHVSKHSLPAGIPVSLAGCAEGDFPTPAVSRRQMLPQGQVLLLTFSGMGIYPGRAVL